MFSIRKRIPGLLYGLVCMILCLAILVQCWLVMDGWTHDDSKYCTSIVLRSKKAALNL